MQEQPPFVTAPSKNVGGHHPSWMGERTRIRIVRVTGEDVLRARDDGNVTEDVDVYVGQEELDVVGVRHDDRPRPQDVAAAAQDRTTWVDARDVIAVRPQGR